MVKSRLRKKSAGLMIVGTAVLLVAGLPLALVFFALFWPGPLPNSLLSLDAARDLPLATKLLSLLSISFIFGVLNAFFLKQKKKVAVILRKGSEINKSIATGILDYVVQSDRRTPFGSVNLFLSNTLRSIGSIFNFQDLGTKYIWNREDILTKFSQQSETNLEIGQFRFVKERLDFEFNLIDRRDSRHLDSDGAALPRGEFWTPADRERLSLENAAVVLNNRLRRIARSRSYHAVVVRPIILNERFRRAVEELLAAEIFVVILQVDPSTMPIPPGLPFEPVFLTPDHQEAGRKLGEFVNTIVEKSDKALLVLAGPANDPGAKVRSGAFLWEVLGTTQHPKIRVEVIDSWAREDKPDVVKNALGKWRNAEREISEAIVYLGSDGTVAHLCARNDQLQLELGLSIKYVSIDGSRSHEDGRLDLQAYEDCLATVDADPKAQGATVVDVLLTERADQKNAARFTPLETKLYVFERPAS